MRGRLRGGEGRVGGGERRGRSDGRAVVNVTLCLRLFYNKIEIRKRMCCYVLIC